MFFVPRLQQTLCQATTPNKESHPFSDTGDRQILCVPHSSHYFLNIRTGSSTSQHDGLILCPNTSIHPSMSVYHKSYICDAHTCAIQRKSTNNMLSTAVTKKNSCLFLQSQIQTSQSSLPASPLPLLRLLILITASSSSAHPSLSSGTSTARSTATGKPLCLPLNITQHSTSLLPVCQAPQKL